MNYKNFYKKGILASILVASMSTQAIYPVLAATTTYNSNQKAQKAQSVEQDVEMIKSRLHNQVVGFYPGGSLDLSIPQIQTYVENVNATAQKHWDAMVKSTEENRTYLWEDSAQKTPYTEKMQAAQISNNFTRIASIAKAYVTNGTDFYQKEEVKDELIKALDFLIQDKWYPKAAGDKGNWWDWEIGVPKALTQTIILLEKELTQEQIDSYVAAMKASNAHVMKDSDTPSNLSDKALQALYIGAIEGDAELIQSMGSIIKRRLFNTVTSGNGFYPDGSYIDHTYHAYTGGYGIVLMSAMSKILPMIADTQFEITSTDGSHNFFNDRVFDAFEPLSVNGLLMQVTSGRGATRVGEQDNGKGRGITSIVALLSQGMAGEQKVAAQRYVKEMISADPEYILEQTDIFRLTALLEIWNDPTIEARGALDLHKRYASMDKVVHHKDNYSFALSMHSNRIANAESINKEGYKTWNTADGMTFIYNKDIHQFNDGWYPTIDQNRMPGTTTENAYRNPTKGFDAKNPHSWVGGTELYDKYGVSGMHLRTLNGGDAPTKSGTDAKKSYFMFDEEIVAVGSDITSTTGNTVETVVENRKIKTDASNTFLINGENVGSTTGLAYDDTVTTDIKGKAVENVSWAHLEGNVDGADIGYYFPSSPDLKVLVEPRTHSWKEVNENQSGEVTHNYATMVFDHGQNPTGESYQYVLLPGKTVAQTQSYTANPKVEILSATSKVHAARQTELGITGYNFWEAASLEGITAHTPCSVMIGGSDQIVDVSLSDPTQKQQAISVVLEGNYEVLEKDGAVAVEYVEGGLRITVDTVGSLGKSYKLKLRAGDKEIAATSIKVNGKVIEGFNPNLSMYTVKLPYGTTAMPKIEVASEHDVKVMMPEAMPGTVTIELTSQTDATQKSYYYIDLEVETQWLKVSSEQAGNEGSNTVDGIEGTRWASEGTNEWIQYYIGEDKVVENIGLKFHYPNADRRYKYSIQVSSDERNWTTLYSNQESTGPSEGTVMYHFETPVEARFVRILAHGSNQSNWNNIDEVTIQLADQVVNSQPVATLEGVDEVEAETIFNINLGVEEAENVYAQDITLSYDTDVFELLGVQGLGNTQVVDTDSNSEGILRILAATEKGIMGRQDLLALNFKAKDTTDTQIGTITVEKMLLGQVVNDEATTSEATTTTKDIEVQGKPIIIEKPEDVNQDGQTDVADLALVAYYYQAKLGDANWEQAKQADVNRDNKVDITDLTLVANKILANN